MASARQTSEVPSPKDGNTTETEIKLVFDKYSPRPHFVVLHKPSYKKQTATDAQIDATFRLVTTFLHTRKEYDKEAILSFHRGAWYSPEDNGWHCHLCVPMAEYCKEAETELDRTYVKTVQERYKTTQSKYTKYKQSTIKDVGKNAPAISFNLPPNVSAPFELVWMCPEPRIGVCIKEGQPPQTLGCLYSFLETVEQGFPSLKDFGCHLCLYVSGSPGAITMRSGSILSEAGKSTTSRLVGYIQLGSTQYWQLLPAQLKPKWIEEFEKYDGYIVVT